MMQGPYSESGLTVSGAFLAIQGEGDELSHATTRLMVANVLRDMLRSNEARSGKSAPKPNGWTPFVAVRYWIKDTDMEIVLSGEE